MGGSTRAGSPDSWPLSVRACGSPAAVPCGCSPGRRFEVGQSGKVGSAAPGLARRLDRVSRLAVARGCGGFGGGGAFLGGWILSSERSRRARRPVKISFRSSVFPSGRRSRPAKRKEGGGGRREGKALRDYRKAGALAPSQNENKAGGRPASAKGGQRVRQPSTPEWEP